MCSTPMPPNTTPEADIPYEDDAIFEYSTFKIPYEDLNREYRAGHKKIGRAKVLVQKSCDIVQSLVSDKNVDGISKIEMRKAYGKLIENISKLEETVKEENNRQKRYCDLLQARLDFLDEPNSAYPPRIRIWKTNRERLWRHAAVHLMRCGHLETAKALSEKVGIEHMVDTHVFKISKQVIDAILNGDTKPCLAWIEMHKIKLRKMNSKLEQAVRVQDAIDLLQNTSIHAALMYMRKHMTITKGDECQDFRKLMGVFASGGMKTKIEAYQIILNEKRWIRLADKFKEEFIALYQLPFHSSFSMCIQCGLCAFKTPHCAPGLNPRCVTCQPSEYALSDGLPHAHTGNSRLLCPYSGEVIQDQPKMFPNGRVYSTKTVNLLSVGGKFCCPKTLEVFNVEEGEGLFIL